MQEKCRISGKGPKESRLKGEGGKIIIIFFKDF